MDDLIMRDGEHEVLAEGVHEAERELLVMVLAVNRVLTHVLKGIVHPAHIPLKGEAQAAQVSRAADHGASGGLLGDSYGARMLGVHQFIHAPEQSDSLQVLAAAI